MDDEHETYEELIVELNKVAVQHDELEHYGDHCAPRMTSRIVREAVCQLLELRQDAERYRWLRKTGALQRAAHIAVLTNNGGYVATEEMADKAIDAAMLEDAAKAPSLQYNANSTPAG